MNNKFPRVISKLLCSFQHRACSYLERKLDAGRSTPDAKTKNTENIVCILCGIITGMYASAFKEKA